LRARKAVQGVCLIATIGLLFGCGAGSAPGKHSPPQDVTPSTQTSRVLDQGKLRAVLPDSGDVPPGWEKLKGRLQRGDPKRGLVASASQGYQAPDLEGTVGFRAASFQTRAQAIDWFANMKDTRGPAQIPDADATFIASYCLGGNYCSTSINLRVDSVYAVVNINTDRPPAIDARILHSVTRMFVQRIKQAQHGQPPSAKAA
jgi:hypothetical protein